MEEANLVLVAISVAITYIGATWAYKRQNQSEGSAMGEMKTDLRYIRESLDMVSHKQDLQGEQILNLVAQIARLEERVDNQEKRIDRMEDR